MKAILAPLMAYVLGFLLFPPAVLIIADEFQYVAQAVAFSRGELTLPGAAPVYPPSTSRAASDYPAGTSLLQTPFVAVAGWRAAAALSVIGLVVATLVTAKWLRERNYDPRFAVLVPAYFGALFFGRLAMSDVPSGALVALALWLLWRAGPREWHWSFLAGLTAGLSLLFREPLAVLLAPFLVGALIRRKASPLPLVIGVGIGLAARAALSYEMFSSALYVRPSEGFALSALRTNLPQYAFHLLVMFPLGALLPIFYRGERREEVRTAFVLYTFMFLLYGYDSSHVSGRAKGLLLTSRFMIPLLPVLALMAADVFPRWFARLGTAFQSVTRRLVPVVFIGLTTAAFGIHVAMHRQEQAPLSIVRAIQTHTSAQAVLITNRDATLKYLTPIYGPRRFVPRSEISARDIPVLFREYGSMRLVFLDRTDSEMFREDAEANERFLSGLRARCAFVSIYDSIPAVAARLRIFDLQRCG